MNSKFTVIIVLLFSFFGCNSSQFTKQDQKDTTNNIESSTQITERYFKLKSISGRNISMTQNQEREMYFILKNEDQQVKGFAGCNSISGAFKIDKGNHISFSTMATTGKTCPEIDMNESALMNVFQLADSFTLVNDFLTLHASKGNALAVFEVIYFN